MRCSEIKSYDIVELARQLSGDKQPQTVGNYLSHLGAIFAVAKPAWGVQLDQQAMKDAYVVAKRLGVTGKSRGRERRPTVDEVKALLAHFEARSSRRFGVRAEWPTSYDSPCSQRAGWKKSRASSGRISTPPGASWFGT